jgi:hypothetical protein
MPRLATCGGREAKVRLAQARSFLMVAEEAARTHGEDSATPNVVAAVAVLAGIAAADAASCSALGQRSRGRDHREATKLLSRVEPGGPGMTRTLTRLLDIKDEAQYGVTDMTAEKASTALRQARSLIEAAAAIVGR